jgi:hypothetical protein
MSDRVLRQEAERSGPTGAETVVRVLPPGPSIRLSPEECWQLYVLLGADAPFVRHQLIVIRRGRGGAVSLSRPEERRQVLHALATGGRDADALTSGLRSLKTALEEGECQRSAARSNAGSFAVRD